jgi:hypothetical protein
MRLLAALVMMLWSMQVDSQPYLVAFDTYNATFNVLNVVAATASINLTIEIDQVYMGVDSDSGFVGIGGDDELMLKLSAPVLSIDLQPLYGATSRSGSVSLTAEVCSFTRWTSTTKGMLSEPIKLLDRRIIPLDSSLSFLDRIGFIFFERPKISFSIIGFEDDAGLFDCTYRSSDDDSYASQTFSDLLLCYAEGAACNVYIGTNAELGWLYFGGSSTAPYYGIHVNPTWSLVGTRRSLDLATGQFFDIVVVPSTSDIYRSQVINATSSPRFEMDEISLRDGSMLLFHLNGRGELMRHLAAYSMTFNASIGIVLDFAEPLAASNATSFSLVLPKLIDAKFGGPASSFVLAVNRAPPEWTVLSQSFAFSVVGNVLSLNATIGVPSAAAMTSTTTATTTSEPPVVATPMTPATTTTTIAATTTTTTMMSANATTIAEVTSARPNTTQKIAEVSLSTAVSPPSKSNVAAIAGSVGAVLIVLVVCVVAVVISARWRAEQLRSPDHSDTLAGGTLSRARQLPDVGLRTMSASTLQDMQLSSTREYGDNAHYADKPPQLDSPQEGTYRQLEPHEV